MTNIDFVRKAVYVGQSDLVLTDSDQPRDVFRIMNNYSDAYSDNYKQVFDVAIDEQTILSYCEKLIELDHENILSPISYYKNLSGKWVVVFEAKIACMLSTLIENSSDSLFVETIENNRTVYGMSRDLQHLFLEVISTVCHVHQFGMVHGRLTTNHIGVWWHNGIPRFKLFGFRVEKDEINLPEHDWKAVSAMILGIFGNRTPTYCISNLKTELESRKHVVGRQMPQFWNHACFFTDERKENIIRVLEAEDMLVEYSRKGLKWPTIPSDYAQYHQEGYNMRRFEDFILFLKDRVDHKKEMLQQEDNKEPGKGLKKMLSDIEKDWPEMWVILGELHMLATRKYKA